MKKILMVVAASISFISSSVLYAGSSRCDVGGFVTDKDRLGLKVRKSSKGAMVDRIPYSEFTAVNIIDYKKGWLKINEWDIEDEKSYVYGKGVKYARNQSRWVYSGMIGTVVQASNYANIYARARKNSKIIAKAKDANVATIVACYRNWVYVKVKASNGKNVEGWLAPRNHCFNLLSSCS